MPEQTRNQCQVASSRSLPTWCRPEWQDDDIYSLSKPELDGLKLKVAVCVQARYKANASRDYGLEVAGQTPLDPTVLKH